VFCCAPDYSVKKGARDELRARGMDALTITFGEMLYGFAPGAQSHRMEQKIRMCTKIPAFLRRKVPHVPRMPSQYEVRCHLFGTYRMCTQVRKCHSSLGSLTLLSPPPADVLSCCQARDRLQALSGRLRSRLCGTSRRNTA
jgi:hypothetical protein